MIKNILIACEFSGTVREAFRELGFNAWSCDVLPSDLPGNHIQGDVCEVLSNGWDLMIAHPPCTYLTNSGVCHLHTDPSRWAKLDKAAEFFRALLNAPIAHIAIENPIPHKYASERIGQKYSQIIQPWQFGHTESKATCLWLKNLPNLEESENVKAEMLLLPANQRQRLHYLPPSKDRWKLRSKTYSGIAKAIALQWSKVLLNNEVKND
jgi:hypothetical protein